MQNGKFPDNSIGDSEKLQFINFGVKGGATYKLSGMHFLHTSAAYMTKAPDFKNSFTPCGYSVLDKLACCTKL